MARLQPLHCVSNNLQRRFNRYRRALWFSLSALVCLSVAVASACESPPTPPPASLPVFPGAQGFGIFTKAGRGGSILRVTNLNDSGPGSLRAAVTATGPRTIIFDVSGTILLKDWIYVRNPFITIAGQSAPSPGITLRGAGISVETNDVLIRHLRIRVGDAAAGPWPGNRDGFQILGAKSYNVVLDHLSVSWAVDETGSSWYSPVRDVTISNSILSEGLNHSACGCSYAKGLLIGAGAKNISIIGNLFAHNLERHPRILADTSVLLVNNLMYNVSKVHTWLGDSTQTAAKPVSFTSVGNLYIRGPNSQANVALEVLGGAWSTGSKIYLANNLAPNGVLYKNYAPTDLRVSSPPIWTNPLTVRDVTLVESWVLQNAGARPLDRDSVDKRTVSEVSNRSGQIIDHPEQVGGWPFLQQNYRPLALPTNPNGDDDSDGYTNLEELLNTLAAKVTG